jgi:GNAT superfamily N-acetyltransferase
MSLNLRPLCDEDKVAWLPLWASYLSFYETELAPEVSENTWARLVAEDGNIEGLGAFGEAGEMIGFTHYLLHPGTWGAAPICYLEDLFVAQAARGTGAGRALIETLASKGRDEGWQSIYWQTAKDNTRAQSLYDKVANRTDWVRYELDL